MALDRSRGSSLDCSSVPSVHFSRGDNVRRLLKLGKRFNPVATMVLIWNDLSTTSNCFLFPSFPSLQKLLHVCSSVIWRPSLAAFFLRNSICCRRYLCS